MTSPAKRRKKNAASQQSRNLDFFFGKQREVAAAAAALPPKKPDFETSTEGLTDERLARKLTEKWAKENEAATPSSAGVVGGSNLGVKRQRSSSLPDANVVEPVVVGREVEKKEDNNAWRMETQETEPKNETKEGIFTIPPTPKKTAVSLEAALESDTLIEEMPFDKDPLLFDPDVHKDIVDKWPARKAPYMLLTRAFVLVNSTRSRIKIVDTLVNLIRTLIRLDPESLLAAVWLTANDIGPPYENNELGVGGSIISKALTKTSGITPAALKKMFNKHGDPGDVAFETKVKQRTLMMRKPTPLTIKNVYITLVKIASTSGKGSQENKQRHVERLLVDAKGEEIRYLTRTLIQHLRIGAVKTTMLIALSRAFTLSAPDGADWEAPTIPESKEGRQELFSKAEEVLKQCFARRPNYNDIIPSLLSGGVGIMEAECGMAIHVPLKPMLGSITRDLAEMLTKLQGRDFSCEFKYDGQRAQIHCDSEGKVSIFSRHLELMTPKYPDLVALVPKFRGEGVQSFIMEGEVVAIDPQTGDIKPFQTLAGRERKNVDAGSISVDVCLFAFDLMFLNGQELLSRPFRERRELMHSMFIEIPMKFIWVKSLDATSADVDAIRGFFRSSLEIKCEGIMVKVLDNSNEPLVLTPEEELEEDTKDKTPSVKKGKEKEKRKWKGGRRKALLATYEPDKRLESWLKVKKDYDSAADTLDLVPIAAWHGLGRKSKWWSPILLAIRNPDTGTFEAVCKCMSGFTDKFYAEMKEFYSDDQNSENNTNTSNQKKAYYETDLHPAIWFEPKEVWEIAFADITLSPTYSAAMGLVSEERGTSLRFPRFLRKREDKSIEEASTPQFLANLYFKQEQGGKKRSDQVVDDAEGYIDDERLEDEETEDIEAR